MDPRSTGLVVIAAGLTIVVVGILILLGGLNWLFRLPGDIRIERGGTRIYVPIVSMLLLSLLLSLAGYIVRRLF